MVTKNTTFWAYCRRRSVQRNYKNGILLTNVDDTALISSEKTRSRTGVNNPKWRSIIKSGGNATTAMSGSDPHRFIRLEPMSLSGFLSYEVGSDSFFSFQYIGGTSGIPAATPPHLGGTSLSEADNQALSRSLANVRAERTKFQGIVSLGELNETLKLLKHPFKAVDQYVNKYLQDLKKSKSFEHLYVKRSRSSRKSFLSVAEDAWLETAFGIRPLISDVKDLTEALIHNSYGSSRNVVVGSGSSTVAKLTENTQGLGAIKYTDSYRDTTKLSVRYKVALDTTQSVSVEPGQRLLDSLGFNLESFIPSIYNLIPWSFLVDYFSNLGDLIEGGTTNQNAVKWVVRTERTVTNRVILTTPVFYVDGWTPYGEAQPGHAEVENRTVSRSTQAKLNLPTLELNLPGSAMKYGNILALMKLSESSILKRLRF